MYIGKNKVYKCNSKIIVISDKNCLSVFILSVKGQTIQLLTVRIDQDVNESDASPSFIAG